MNSRLKDIYESASRLFIRQGYSRTQIGHIAKAVGVSVGTMYLDFAGKKEIMQFVLKCTISPDFMDGELERPITDNAFVDLDNQIEMTFENILDEFSVKLSDNDGYSFDAFIADAFDLVAQYAVGCLFIEKNQYEFEKLAGYYKRFRARFFEIMLAYVSRFIETGTIRKPKYLHHTVAHIIETLTWWGMDIHYSAFETLDISLEQAKAVVLDNLVPAYLQ